MKLLKCAIASVALLGITSLAAAHPVGRVCAYTNSEGWNVTDYCHHLRQGYPARPYYGRPGITLDFGGLGLRFGNRGWRGRGDRGRGRGEWRRR